MARIVVVGGSLGGLRVTEALYARGWEGEIVVVSEETHPPYTRPPLSKSALTSTPDIASLVFKRRPEADRATWLRGVRAVSCDLSARIVRLSDGTVLTYDGLVAASGVRPRRLPARMAQGGHVLRTFEDCAALQPRLTPGARIVVIGAGFIGCEVAATAVRLGCRVDVVALDEAPMITPLGRTVATAIQRRHEQQGVTFHLGRRVAGIEAEGSGYRIMTADGTVLTCDLFVEAIGSEPCVEWLEGNGLDLADGVECDNWMRMGGHIGAVAVGDVARFPNPMFDDQPRRVEHWQMPGETAQRAAATLLSDLAREPADPSPFHPLPSFWSDQYDLRLQSFGAPGLADRVEVLEGDLDTEALIGYYRGEALVGVLLIGLPRKAVQVRRRLLAELTPVRVGSGQC